FRKPVGQPPSKPPQRRLKPPRPSGPDPAAPASSRHQPQPVRRPCCCLEPLETAGKRSSFGRFSNLSFSLIRPPNQSCEAPGVQLIHRRDLREVQLARTSSRRRTKETTRAIILAPDPPPRQIEKGKGKKVIRARHSPGVGHAQDSARIPKRKLGRVLSPSLDNMSPISSLESDPMSPSRSETQRPVEDPQTRSEYRE
ncbi:hypothetical protein Prudu_004200, partial [Prunus dulcis]